MISLDTGFAREPQVLGLCFLLYAGGQRQHSLYISQLLPPWSQSRNLDSAFANGLPERHRRKEIWETRNGTILPLSTTIVLYLLPGSIEDLACELNAISAAPWSKVERFQL